MKTESDNKSSLDFESQKPYVYVFSNIEYKDIQQWASNRVEVSAIIK
ncbi:hypothetical protein [Veronia pacifica]|nr:hypothetical protein [Veronia pacifica]